MYKSNKFFSVLTLFIYSFVFFSTFEKSFIIFIDKSKKFVLVNKSLSTSESIYDIIIFDKEEIALYLI